MATISSESAVKDNFLRIGDYVSLKFPKYLAYLSAEGILVEDVYVSPLLSFFEEHLFQIYVQRQYSATNELEDFLESSGGDPNLLDPATASYMEALTRGKENESILNRTVMKGKTGNIVCFGDTIQLLHVKSNKYVTIKPSDLARDERENMRVALSHDGSVMSWLKIMPRFKINREGEPVANGTEILLKVNERSNEYLHCADRPPPRGKFREVNSSLESPTGWKLSIFQRSEELLNTNLLLSGQLLTIKDPESQCMLAPLIDPISLDSPFTDAADRPQSTQDSVQPFDPADVSHKSVSEDENDDERSDMDELQEDLENVSLTSMEEFVRDNGNVVMRPIVEDVIDADCVWMIESKSITKGGVIRYKADKVHFRHLNSGKYLSVQLREDSNDEFILCLEKDPDERKTLFFIQELHGAGEELHNSKAVQIKHAYFGVYLQRGIFHDSEKIFSCLTTRSKGKALSTIAARYIQKENVSITPHIHEETLDVYFAKAVMYHLQKFVKATAVPSLLSSETNPTFWPKIDPVERNFFSPLLLRTTLFVRGYPIRIKPGSEEFLKYRANKTTVLKRQNMLREVGLLEAIMVMIKFLQPISRLINTEASTNRIAKGGYLEFGKSVLSECLYLLFDLIKDNTSNQLYIADHLLIILSHVSTDKMAAQIAQELLSSNRELQETKIGVKEITIFTEKMRDVHMNSMYLNLLRTCCACLGQGLPRNQEIVNNVLFHQYKDVLIEVILDNKTTIAIPWNADSVAFTLFYKSKQTDESKVRADELYSIGVPTIRLTWKTKSNRFAIMKLFNRSEVLLSEVVERDRNFLRAASMKMSSKSVNLPGKLSVDDLKRNVADFFVSQLLLAGEMCLDRNYPVLLEMEKIYTYELLITMLKTVENESLKSAAAYLLHNAYVNREPQSEVPLPRYTRTLTEINQPNCPDLVCLPAAVSGQFALLQILVAEHLEDIQGKPFPMDSLNTLGLMYSLVKFSYYGNVEKLSYTVKILTNCLSRGEFDTIIETDTNIGISIKKAGLQRGTSRKNLMAKSSRISIAPSTQSMNSLEDDNGTTSLKESNENSQESNSNEHDLSLSKTILGFIESNTAHYVMIIFAILASGVTVWEIVTHTGGFYMRIFEAVVLAIFIWELMFHIVFYLIVHKDLMSFFMNPFNCMDVITVALYALAFRADRFSIYAKFVRLSRIFILYKIYYLVNDATNATGDGIDQIVVWIPPNRYLKTSDYTVNCLVQIIQILIKIQKNIEDRSLSIFLKKFSKWQSDPKAALDQCGDIFHSVIHEASDLLISDEDKDHIYMDLLMYSNQCLVQVTLDLLMMHHSSQKILLDNITKLQLITSGEDEKLYNKLERIVGFLKRHAETHEIWGRLETEENSQINSEMHKCLLDLLKDCKKLREVLKFDESHEPVKFVQNVLRNLGCFEVCMKISQLILTVNKDDPNSDSHKNTRLLAYESNQLIYWFAIDNPTNQAIVYEELKFFIKTVDMKILSHRVISAIFKDNIDLMELVPKKFIGEFVELICNVGKFPQYLTLMSSIINVGEKNMIRNQYEVIRLMSSPENIKKITQYFVPFNHVEYNKKIRLMSHYLTAKDVTVEDLPSDLAYHLELMKLLSSCTIGTSGMTSIEAKVQSMFHFVDIIDGMLDPNCLLLAKIRMGLFLYNAMLDVETPIPAIKDAACIWKLLIASQDVFTFAKDELRQIEKNGWDYPTSNRQKIEFMLVNAMIVEAYFHYYYDFTIFKPDFGQVAVGVERIQMKEYQGNEIIHSLYQKIHAIYEMMSPLLAPEHHALLFDSLKILNDCSKEKIVAEVENIHDGFLKAAQEYQAGDEQVLNKSYDRFVEALNKCDSVKKSSEEQIQHFLEKIEQLPWKTSPEKSDVRFEPFVEKLVSHVRSCVQVVIHGDDSIKFMNPNATKTSIWILKMFRTMIENRWGMTIYERDDDGGEDQDNAVIDLMKVFNQSGMTEMCLDLIAKGIDISLQAEALKLLVGMLFKEGGALDIQKSIHHHLSKSGSDMFFRTVRQILHNLMSWHKWNGIITLEEGSDPELPDEIIIVRCLQLMCEGHYLPNQDLFREQPNNYTSFNLLDDFVAYLQCLDSIKCRTSTAAELAVSAVILEVIQGPCEGNQNYFALNTELIETLNRKIRQRPVNDCDEEEEFELKKGSIDILQALLEGQGRKTAIYERMLSVIHIDVLLVLCRGKEDLADDPEKKKKNNEEESESSQELRTESLVLLQMLTDFRPSLKVEYGLGDDFSQSSGGDSVACIEVVWHGELQRRFFHIPDICGALAKSTKDNFILEVKRDSPEDKLYGLLEAAKEMYREVSHQQYLKELGIDKVFSRTNQDRVIWCNFYIVLAINIFFILFYTTDLVPCGEKGLYQSQLEYMPTVGDDASAGAIAASESKLFDLTSANTDVFCSVALIREGFVKIVILALNIVLICGSTFSLLSSLVVRAPVNFQRLHEKGYGIATTIFYTTLDFFTVYYALYLVIAFMGLLYHPCLSFLLLDFITMSPATQAVLNAVYEPRRAIFMSLLLVVIIMYIYAFFHFFFYATPPGTPPDEVTYQYPQTIVTLGNLVKYMLRYGFPFASPENQVNNSIDTVRLVNDVSFFMVCLIMLNILKGITIDTFVSLRKKLETRIEDTQQKCFICGIEKNTFNRTLDRTAFQLHIKVDQNLWNYIYFIMYVWEQDKDDDDGLESYVRKCISNNDLTWFPMNKAIRLAQHQEKGDVTSLKYRFRKDMERTEQVLYSRMLEVKDQISRTIARVEKALEYEQDADNRRSRTQAKSVRGSDRKMQNGEDNTDSITSQSQRRKSVKDEALSVKPKSASPRARSPLITGIKSATALDADILGQMHLRMVSISGLLIPPSFIQYLSVKVISDYDLSILSPLPNLQSVASLSKPGTPNISLGVNENPTELSNAQVSYRSKAVEKVSSSIKNTKSSFILNRPLTGERSTKDSAAFSSELEALNLISSAPSITYQDDSKKMQLRFDLLNNPPTLIHQGSLPKSDLSKIRVKVQIMFNLAKFYQENFNLNLVEESLSHTDFLFLGGVSIPLTTLITKAHEGKLLDVSFAQTCVEISFPDLTGLETEKQAFFTNHGIDLSVVDEDTKESVETNKQTNFNYRRRKSSSRGFVLLLPSNDSCTLTVSSMASHKLLQDWAFIKSIK